MQTKTKPRGPMNPVKSSRPTREELRAMVKKLRDVAMYCSATNEVADLIIEADLLLVRGASGGYVKKTERDHARIRSLAPLFLARVEFGDPVLAIARDHQVNRTTVRKHVREQRKKRQEILACANVVLGPECEGRSTL